MGVFKRGMQFFGITSNDGGRRASRAYAGMAGEAIRHLQEGRQRYAQRLQPITENANLFQPQMQSGATIDGYSDSIHGILDSGAFNSLIDRQVKDTNAALGAVGLRRSGSGVNHVGSIPIQTAMQIESMLRGRQAELYHTGVNALGAVGAADLNTSAAVAGAMLGVGTSNANGILTDVTADMQGMANRVELAQDIATMSMMSDRRMKTDIRHIGHYGRLKLYEWLWLPGIKPSKGALMLNVGFMADEVQEVFPDCVESINGILHITNIPKVLEAAL